MLVSVISWVGRGLMGFWLVAFVWCVLIVFPFR